MAEKLQKRIIDYFSFFEEFYNTSKTCLKDCQDCAISINKLIKRCKNIREAELIGTPLEEFSHLQNKLSAAFHNQITEDIQEIKGKLSSLETLFESLVIKHTTFLDTYRQVNLEPDSVVVKGTPFQPPLEQLLEFAEDTITFGGQICGQIESSLNALTYKGLYTDSLVENFRIFPDWQRRIPEILAYTSFCPENKV